MAPRRGIMKGLMMSGLGIQLYTWLPRPALAKKKVPLSEYAVTPKFSWRDETHAGVRFYDLKEGKGPELDPTAVKKVSVHYDCSYKSVVAVSTRQAVVLSQNRYIEKPYEFKYGVVPEALREPLEYKDASGVGIRVDPDPIYTRKLFVTKIYPDSAADGSDLRIFDEILRVNGKDTEDMSRAEVNELLEGESGTVNIEVERNMGKNERGNSAVKLEKRPYKKLIVKKVKKGPEKSGGLYSGEDLAPPPDILFVPDVLKGMRKGGLRRIEVPADLGYGPDGKNEIPGDAPFFVDVELVDVFK
eukprot:CAMPEP_0170176336 /NCGR_PEP_ID=MMETSP0040_2-20121228/9238_1 /TAXON_ID=641309 /ORGANISM="Lotharella oceanica, Strain CCMP622" /LENGTH=300 /DNA_ID=CAMNT_0010418621 /DNA_START=148 /DNA_END=1050 /DNA_ORIENTATION=-